MSQAIQESAAQGGSLANLCQRAGISRTCYYRGLCALEPTNTDVALRESIQRVALDCSCYGYRRVTKELHRQGIQTNHKRVLRLMRQGNLLCLRKKWFVATTDSAHGLPVYPSLAAEMDSAGPTPGCSIGNRRADDGSDGAQAAGASFGSRCTVRFCGVHKIAQRQRCCH